MGKKNNDTGLNDIRPKPGLSWANWDVHVPRYKVKVKVTQSCPTLCDPHGLYNLWNSPDQSTGVGSLSLLQGILSTQGSNPGLPHCRRTLYQLSHREAQVTEQTFRTQEARGSGRAIHMLLLSAHALSFLPSLQMSPPGWWTGTGEWAGLAGDFHIDGRAALQGTF